MTVHRESPTGELHSVHEHLAAEFDGVVPPTVVAVVVRDAERDLQGQVVPGALDEMLHRLVEVRLHELTRDACSRHGPSHTADGDGTGL